jgi:large subunit ribosomal protein L27
MQASSTQKTKDSAGRRLGNLIKKGVKKLGGHEVFPGDILVRQRGFRWHNGKNTTTGKDHTIHSLVEGVVQF